MLIQVDILEANFWAVWVIVVVELGQIHRRGLHLNAKVLENVLDKLMRPALTHLLLFNCIVRVKNALNPGNLEQLDG